MTLRPIDPRRLDVADAARRGESLSGAWPLAGFARLTPMLHASADAAALAAVRWHLHAGLHRRAGAPAEPRLHLQVTAQLWLECQRCLQAVEVVLQVDRVFRFVADEASAEAEDAASEDEVLALPAWLDLHALVEDELLLDLPLVPRHERCAAAAALSADRPDETAPAGSRKPFAVLATLGKTGRH